MKKPSPLAKAEAAVKDESAKKMAEKIVERRAVTKSAAMPKPAAKKEEPVMSEELQEKAEKAAKEEPVKVSVSLAYATPPPKPAAAPMPANPSEDQLCLIRRRGNITLARYRGGEFYASHAGFYSDLVDKPDAWMALPEF